MQRSDAGGNNHGYDGVNGRQPSQGGESNVLCSHGYERQKCYTCTQNLSQGPPAPAEPPPPYQQQETIEFLQVAYQPAPPQYQHPQSTSQQIDPYQTNFQYPPQIHANDMRHYTTAGDGPLILYNAYVGPLPLPRGPTPAWPYGPQNMTRSPHLGSYPPAAGYVNGRVHGGYGQYHPTARTGQQQHISTQRRSTLHPQYRRQHLPPVAPSQPSQGRLSTQPSAATAQTSTTESPAPMPSGEPTQPAASRLAARYPPSLPLPQPMMPDPLVDIDPNEPFFHQLVDVRNGRLREGLPAPRILWPVAEGPSPSSSEQTAVEEGSADQQTVLTDEASEDAQGSGEGEEGEH